MTKLLITDLVQSMQQDLHHESEHFFNLAIQKRRSNSHGSLRNKTTYGFLSVVRINRTTQEFDLTIFLPQVTDCISFCWSNRVREKYLQYPKNINRPQVFKLLRKALEKNEDNLERKSSDFNTSKWEGVYLWRSCSKVGETGTKNFKTAFNGSIPQIFIDKCKEANITLKKYGKDPFKFSLIHLRKI